MRLVLGLVIPFLMAASPAPRQYLIDPSSSYVVARVALFGVASKEARFPRANGGVTIALDDPSAFMLNVELDARMLTASDPLTLSRLRGAAFFDVVHHPTVSFTSRRMVLKDDRTAVVVGQLTARGVSHPASLTAQFDKPPFRSGATERVTLDGVMTIDRDAYGMTAYHPVVGRQVTIQIHADLALA